MATIARRSGHDRAVIGLRSWTFRLLSSIGIVRHVLEESLHSFHDEEAMIAAQSHHDHGFLQRIFPAVQWRVEVSWMVPILQPSDLPPLLKMAQPHPLASHVRWRSDAPERSTYHQGEKKIKDPRVRLIEIARFERMNIGHSSWRHMAIGEHFDCGHLKHKSRTCCDFDRVDSDPRDQRSAI